MSPPSSAISAPLLFLSPAQSIQFSHHHHHHLPFSSYTNSFPWHLSRAHSPTSRFLLKPPLASISRYSYDDRSSVYDAELRLVLELATDSELYELERILFGPSYFSPLFKSFTKREDVDLVMIGEDPEERENFISMLESRFLFLAADAKSTLRGWRPSYRNVLLGIRKKLKVPCSAKLSAEALEVEIFLHLLQEYSSEEYGIFSSSNDSCESNNLELGLSPWKVQKLAALNIGAKELPSMILKGGGMLTLEKLFEILGGRLSRTLFSEAAKYEMKKEFMRKSGTLAAINLESRAAFLAANQGLKVAAARYLGLRSVAQLIGPMMWGTLLADVVIQMLGTDYARILRAIYAFAQIRIYRSHKTSEII